MATPNYQYEKRRRDLAKQAKKKEKAERKLQKPESTTETEAPAEAKEE